MSARNGADITCRLKKACTDTPNPSSHGKELAI
jgi:hypothetical protein